MGASDFLAFDLGAESGRAMVGRLEAGRLEVREVRRFANTPVRLSGHLPAGEGPSGTLRDPFGVLKGSSAALHWNVPELFEEMMGGMAACAEGDYAIASVGVDTWGVDFGLLDGDGNPLGLPYAYRDERTEGAMEAFCDRMLRERVYELTGIQFLRFNSLFQLFAMVREGSPLLERASDLLFMPDLFNYLLTREKKSEFTLATTSQLYNPRRNGWEPELFEALGVPVGLMQEIVPPGTVIGRLTEDIGVKAGLGQTPVVATASHDTAAAVAAAPGEGEDWAYISSGTWSLMGVESPHPVITEQSLAMNFTNEGGVGHTFRLLKNIMGLWLVQQCRRAWERDRQYNYEELGKSAAEAQPFKAMIVPDDPGFMNPPDMLQAVAAFCERTGQPRPETPGEYVRCALESLALKYRMTLEELRLVWGRPIRRIHVIGGGAQNQLLCQLTANATGVPVIAGPAEATAIGNLLVQAMAMGEVGSRVELREIVRRSFPVKLYHPERSEEWEAAYERFGELHQLYGRAAPLPPKRMSV
jgi:rhamnulokinase